MIRRLYLAIRDRRIRRRSEDVRLVTWWALIGDDVRAEKDRLRADIEEERQQ